MATNKIEITPDDSVVPVYRVELSDAEIAEREAEYQSDLETKQEIETERATKLASAITKLKALGLTEAEAKVVIGIE
jgi:hypothetical protein